MQRGSRASIRETSAQLAERGFVNINGKPFAAMSVSNMLAPAPKARTAR